MRVLESAAAIATEAKDAALDLYLKRSIARPRVAWALAGICGGMTAQLIHARASRVLNGSRLLTWHKYRNRWDIWKFARSIDEVCLESEAFYSLPTLELELDEQDRFLEPVRIRLASHTTDFSDDLFDHAFADEEDAMSLHRFVWMLILLHEHPSRRCIDFCLRQIAAWCAKYPESDNSLCFNAYTIAERLVAWLHCLMLAKKHVVLDPRLVQALMASYRMQLLALVRRLEYRGEQTSNHILNDARGLYICGSLLSLPAIRELGKRILFRETDRFIIDGALVEGSSHYQMLLTKSYLEIYHAAALTADGEVLSWIKPRVSRMIEVCGLLQSRFEGSEYPLFGDISPDVDPDWLAGYPFCPSGSRRSRWHGLLNVDCAGLLQAGGNENAKNGTSNGKSRQTWHVLRANNWEAWVVGKTGIERHGHNDNGGLVAFFQGRPLLIDLGLRNYLGNDENARGQKGCAGHNSPRIGGISPDIDRDSVFRSNRVRSVFKLNNRDNRSVDFKVVYADRVTALWRKVALEGDVLVVVDSVSSCTLPCSYESHWYIDAVPGNVQTGESRTLIHFADGLEVAVEDSSHTLSVEVVETCRADRYGGARRVAELIVRSFLKKDDKLKLSFFPGVHA